MGAVTESQPVRSVTGRLGPALRAARASPYLGLVIVTMIWGGLHPLGKLAMHEVTPVQLILARVVFAGLTLTLILASQGQAGTIVKEVRERPQAMIGLGALSFFASSGSSMLALSLLPASVSSLLSNTSPLFVAIGAIAASRAKTTRGTVLGILIGFVGLALVVFGENPDGFGTLALNPLGIGLALNSSLTWAIYIGVSRRILARGNALGIIVASALFGSVPWVIVSIIHGDLATMFLLPPTYWLILFFLGVIGTGFTYSLWTAALKRLSASNVAVFQYAIPFWAVILSVLILGERVTIPLVLGGIGIVGGIALTQRAGK